jgi:hypothetical protein
MTKSTFYSDGFVAATRGYPFSPPCIPVYASEYKDGWNDGLIDAECECHLDKFGISLCTIHPDNER